MTENKEVLGKLQKYCAYQERCHSEVRHKLLSLNVYGDTLEEVIAQLIKDDFLNEQRFAETYAGGKFRIKKWGKQKIIQSLKQKKVSDYCIKKGLQVISSEDYSNSLQNLAQKYIRQNQNKSLPLFHLRRKTIQFLQRKGYEYPLIVETLDGIL